MEKKTNKGIIAACIIAGIIICVLIGVLIGKLILNRGAASDELVTDAFCELNKSSGEDYYYRIPKLNINKPWAEEVNEKMYNTLYDEYQKGTVLYDGENPASAEMGYEWTEKDSVISIVVQIKSNVTGGYEFFTFNIDTGKEREITDEELIEIFGYEKTEYFDRIRESVKGIYDKEISEMPPTDYVYDSLLENSQSNDTLENSMTFINSDGALNVIIPVFSGEDKDNVLSIIDPETGTVRDYFVFDGEYEVISPEIDLAENTTAAEVNEDVERLELTDGDISDLMNIMKRDLGFNDFDCENTDTLDIITNQLTFSLGVHFYSLYFDDYIDYDDYSGFEDSHIRPSIPDPLNRFSPDMHYMVLPEENVKWLVENVYHTEYDPDFVDKKSVAVNGSPAYAYEGNVYVGLGYGGGVPQIPELVSSTRLSDGRYEVAFHDTSSIGLNMDKENIYDYSVLIVDVQMIDGRRCLTFYRIEKMNERKFRLHSADDNNAPDNAPADRDYQDLFDMAAYGMADFNSNTVDTAYVINKYITSIFGIGDYAIYFDDAQVCGEYASVNVPDPRGMFEYYSKLPAENVKWMCENVYNIEFDENYVSDNSYCEGGYVYTYAIAAGDGPRASQVKTMEKMSDGRYSIVLENGWNYDNPDVIDVECEIYIIAEIKTTDGIRHWSFYDVKTKNLRTY